MESIVRYLTEMMKHLPERDDNLLFNHHKLTVERMMANVDKEVIGEAFMNIVDSNWEKCEDICRETLANRILSDKTENSSENYWSRMKRLQTEYNADIGEFLCSKMQFIRLEYLDARQNADFNTLMEEWRKQAIDDAESSAAAGTEGDVSSDATRDATASAGAAEVSEDRVHLLLEDEATEAESLVNESISGNEEHFERELKLRMTWGRAFIFWKYWIECRKETIDSLNKFLAIFLDEMPIYSRNMQVFLKKIEPHHGFENYLLQFAHVVNKDLFCHKVLLRKLKEFIKLVKSSEFFDAFGVEPKDLFFNISTFEKNISVRQLKTCRGYERCENIICQERERLVETAKLLAYKSRPLFHLKDLLRMLSDEGRLNRAGVEGVINDLHQEQIDMSTMLNESLLPFMEIYLNLSDAAEHLRKVIKEWLPTRVTSIKTMKEIIEKLNKTAKDVAIAQAVSSSVGIVGGIVAIAGLIAAPFTLGVSLIPTAIAGGVLSGVGAATAIGAAIAEIVIAKGDMEKAKICIEEDEVLFMKVVKMIENLNRNSTMLLRYIPQDELESLISIMIDPQSTALPSISSKSQVDPRIAINVARFVSIGGKTVLMPVSRLAIAGTIAASRVALIALAHSIVAIGVVLDIANLGLAGMKLATGAISENAVKLEKVVKEMEAEKVIFIDVLDKMNSCKSPGNGNIEVQSDSDRLENSDSPN